jgi:Ca2+:H+ antiporter
LENKREQLNGMFGMLKFKGHIARRPLGERSEAVRALYQEQANRPRSLPSENTVYTVGNVLYTLLFGWWLALVYYIAGAVVFITIFGQDYTFMCWRLAGYYFFPFNKTVYRVSTTKKRQRAMNLSHTGPRPVEHFLVFFCISWREFRGEWIL